MEERKPVRIWSRILPLGEWLRSDRARTVHTLEEVEQLDWELWLLSFLVIILLLISFILNHSPGLVGVVPDVQKPSELEVYVDGMAVLVLLFCLYVIQKHRQLMTLRNELVSFHIEQEGLSRRLGVIECLFDVTSSLDELAASGGPWEDLLERLRIEMEADRCLLWLAGTASELSLAAGTGDAVPPMGDRLAVGAGFPGWVAMHGDSLLLELPANADDFDGLTVTDRGSQSALYVPLHVDGEVRGVLGLDVFKGDRRFNEADRKLLLALAGNMAYAIARTVLIEQLRESLQQVSEAQMRVIQTEKLAGLGELMAGISHELNNPLSVVVGHSELLLRSEEVDEAIRDRLEKVAGEAMRAKQLIENLLRVARGEGAAHESLDFNELISQSVRLLRYQLELEEIETEVDLADDLPRLTADRFQLQQLIFNMVNNSRQAMYAAPAGARRLCLRTSLAQDGVPGRQDGPALLLEVADMGPGIPDAHLRRIFDPFFTTKQADGGTGLGLSIVHRTVQEHGGAIEARNREEGGAQFLVWLPLREEGKDREEKVGDLVPPTVSVEPGTVLIVDDEEKVREVLEEVFSLLGHRVLSAVDGQEAQTLLTEEAPPEAIVLDLKMPVMDGEELFRWIREEREELEERVLFLTGDTLSKGARAFLSSSGRPFVSKPFTFNELREQVEALMRRNH